MEKVSILHLITAAKNVSPFDVNMAYDAGFDKIMPYTSVTLPEVMGLTQDTIFSRSQSGLKRESIFIGGRDIDLAMDMQATVKNSMFAPFEISSFSDPSGAFTTAAAMMAKVEYQLIQRHGSGFEGRSVSIFGAGGPVGGCAAIIAAFAGATVELVAHRALSDIQEKADAYNERYGISTIAVGGASDVAKKHIIEHTDVVICAAAAGIRVLDLALFSQSKTLKVVADVNAVPPSGIDGVDAMTNGELIAGTQISAIGALAIGKVKYQIQQSLLKQMLTTDHVIHLDFNSAFSHACELLRANTNTNAKAG